MSIKRRDFLKFTGAASCGVVFGKRLIHHYSRRRGRCVVIGAGLAGLSAAYVLQRAGWEVTIIEARNRIGGRVFSYALPENPNLLCELGAEWVGESHERLIAHCREFGLPLQKHQFSDYLMLNGHVSRPSEWDYSPEANAAWKKLLEDYESYSDEQKRELDRIDWWTFLSDLGFQRNDMVLRELADSTDFGESIRHVSAYAALAEYAESSEHNEMDLKLVGGNSRLVDEFVKRIGRQNIRTGLKVAKVSQANGLVTINAGDEVFQGDACICTAPTAAIRKIEFDPPLPADKAFGLSQLSYSRIIKNSVLYSQRFWKADDFSMITDTTSHYYFHSTQNQAGTEGILTAYAIGDKADVLASQDLQRRRGVIARDLVDFHPQAPELARGIASYAWQTDEYTAGAYAMYRPGQWFDLRPILQRPHGKVLFAGEHLADWQGFMEGAIETGESAAESLLAD